MTTISKGEQEKIQLEHKAAKVFMRAYELKTGHKIRHISHNKPRRPDTSCMLDDEHLDLEIAHLYGSELEAMEFLGRELSQQSKRDLQALNRACNVNDRLLTALNLILENKSKKQYKSNRVWLVIRNVHPEWDVNTIKCLLPQIEMPNGHPFDQIWLVAEDSDSLGIVQIY